MSWISFQSSKSILPGEKKKPLRIRCFLRFGVRFFCPTKLKIPWTRLCYHHCFGFFLGKPPKVDNDSHLRLAELEIAEAWSCVVKSSAGRLRCAALQVWRGNGIFVGPPWSTGFTQKKRIWQRRGGMMNSLDISCLWHCCCDKSMNSLIDG